MTSRLFTDPGDDYALPKALNMDGPTWCANWEATIKDDIAEQDFEQQRKVERSEELDLDRPRWGEMGGEDE